MTCIVGLEWNNNAVYIGGDSASVSGSHLDKTRLRKVFKVSNQYGNKLIIGYTTSFRMGQLLQYSLKLPKHNKHKSDLEYLATDFIYQIRKSFKDGGYSTISQNEEEGGFFLVGYKDTLYKVNSDFHINTSKNGFDAVGSGKKFALGSIYTSLYHYHIEGTDKDAEELIYRALDTARSQSTNVCAPFYTLDTRNYKYVSSS